MLPNDLITDLARFEQELQELASVLQLDLSAFYADHISLRCHQNTTAESWKAALLEVGSLLSENLINGRPISLFILDKAIVIGPWQITCIELPWPGGKYYPHEGWEHVELVLPGDAETLHQRALACLSDDALRTPGIKLKFSSPQGEKERIPNPTLAVTNGKVTIKFHPFDIRDVVASEMSSL
ncbi:VOC family protein [Pectobacterium parmentieri]|uniref:VOC family protein n=1 Tax=Pectobacterium parmentieri TaxID=1905730 RepID=A0A8B3F8E4_PECPM|nr:VOC family protein [Pectobacterium parmentieri]AOR58933.1 metalloprotein [Pectobacterium parmentieri]AYH10034.1 VOC family protein [Pectobacterium parmentieri]AYH19255.1 VOC family protein [Pectobacterium parmentieri]AYH36354.1 VOC family protein [Pectobacterium parmentieri]AZS56459.1 VOC family protein [Pectobacterium parmentieri]